MKSERFRLKRQILTHTHTRRRNLLPLRAQCKPCYCFHRSNEKEFVKLPKCSRNCTKIGSSRSSQRVIVTQSAAVNSNLHRDGERARLIMLRDQPRRKESLRSFSDHLPAFSLHRGQRYPRSYFPDPSNRRANRNSFRTTPKTLLHNVTSGSTVARATPSTYRLPCFFTSSLPIVYVAYMMHVRIFAHVYSR